MNVSIGNASLCFILMYLKIIIKAQSFSVN